MQGKAYPVHEAITRGIKKEKGFLCLQHIKQDDGIAAGIL